MKKAGYDPRLSAGAVAAGGVLGVLIPPSMSRLADLGGDYLQRTPATQGLLGEPYALRFPDHSPTLENYLHPDGHDVSPIGEQRQI